MSAIDGKTRLAGIIGWPVSHSLSPVMHNALYDALGLNWRYMALPVQPARVAEAVYGIRALGLAGVNVTIPHKETVMPHMDELTPAAHAIGAVNTIINKEDKLIGDNTDVSGFLEALDRTGVSLAGRRALILGAGGAARAAAWGLLTRDTHVLLLARTPARAHKLAEDMRQSIAGASIEVVEQSPRSVDLVVNCTPIGMPPHDSQSPLPEALSLDANTAVMDMIYRPLETMLLRQAREAGAICVSGLDMLVYQGVIAFERWTGQTPPADVMRTACLQALGEQTT
jgi:shikimate dehydrogenase